MTLTVRDFTSGAAAAPTAVALPAGAQIGDLLVGIFARAGSNTPPTLPTGWTSVASGGAASESLLVASRVMQSGDTTVTSANNGGGYVIIAFVGGAGVAVGATGTATAATSGTPTVPSVPLSDADGSSRVITIVAHRDATAIDTPDGATEIAEVSGSAAGSRLAVSLTGLVTSWAGDASVPVTLAGVAAGQGWRGQAIEITGPNPVGGPHTGTATGTLAWSGAAVGIRAPRGSASLSLAWEGVAVGRAPSTDPDPEPPRRLLRIGGARSKRTGLRFIGQGERL